MMMSDSTREKKDVLKLVYPHRRVEIYTQPVTAAEVMKRNPRHCVARPDVFKHPWVVVKPESVLFPGKVFYIVPNRTIYHLLQSREQSNNQTNLKQNHQPHDHKPTHRTLKKALSYKSSPGNNPKFKNQNPYFGQAFSNKLWEGESSNEDDADHCRVQQSYVKSRRSYEISKHKNLMEKKVGVRSQHEEENQHHRYSTSALLTQNEYLNREIKCRIPEKKLKSCLRKSNRVRKTLGLRVTFANPIVTKDAESPDSSQNFQAPQFKTREY